LLLGLPWVLVKLKRKKKFLLNIKNPVPSLKPVVSLNNSGFVLIEREKLSSLRTKCVEVEVKRKAQGFIEGISLIGANEIGKIEAKNVIA